MKTAVAILNWNGRALLEEFLPSVDRFSKDAKIYVIDNASSDDSVSYIKEKFPSVKIVQNEGNFGYAKGYNEGLKKILELPNSSRPEIFCLLNSDVKVTENWLKPVERLFQSDSEIAAVQPKIRDYKKTEYFEYAGAAGGFLDNLGYPYCRGRVFWDVEKDEGQYDENAQIFWASGACLFVRTDTFLQLEGFDEGFFAHMEEIDFCWRINNLGKKVYCCGESKIFHLGGGTLKANNPRKTYLNFRNSLWMLVKNLPKGKVFTTVFSRLSLDGVTGIVFLINEGFPHLWAVLKSHFIFYKYLPIYLKKRKPGLKNYYSKKFLPFQYFIKRKKNFKSLT